MFVSKTSHLQEFKIVDFLSFLILSKTIERMRKAQKYKEVLHQLKQTGSNNVHKKTLASMESASSSSNTTTCMISYNNSHGASSNTNNTMNSKFQQKPSR